MNNFQKLYKKLRKNYGTPKGQWKLWCKRPKNKKEREEVAIGAILTQRTNWKNVEIAIQSLKNSGINSLKDIYQVGEKKLAPLIKASGFYKVKTHYLFNLTKFILENYNSLEKMKKINLKKLRTELLKLKGIGPETADSILLYALEKPVFVIDEYTKRLVKKYKLSEKTDYHSLQELFEKNLKKNYRQYQDFHALIVIDAKNKKNNQKEKISLR